MEIYQGMSLDDKDSANADWYEIRDKSTELYERLGKMHKNLESVRTPIFFPRKFREDLKEGQKDFPSLSSEFNDWWLKARNFTEGPHFVLTYKTHSPLDKGIAYLHFSSLILNRIVILETKMNNMTRDFYQYGLMLKHKEGSFYSILFFSISILISVILSIVSLFSVH